MSDRSRMLRGGARAATGLVVVGVCASAVLLLGQVELPGVEREPVAVTVDSAQNTARNLVCAGPFAELGADPARPGVAVPTGSPGVVISGEPAETRGLERAEGGESPPLVLSAPVEELIGAAQIQAVSTEGLSGAAASACAEPLNEQWLLGGSTALGVSTTLSLGNPGSVPATVQISVYDEAGPVDAVQTAGVLVAAGAEQTVSLNGYAPERERLAVRVISTGAPVTASLGVGQTSGISPFAVSSVTRQLEPETQLVLPGVANRSDHGHGPSDSGEGDDFPVVVRALAPAGEEGAARVRAVDADGRSVDLGEIALADSAVGELVVPHWPEEAEAVIVEADAPVVAAALGSATDEDGHDYEWFAPAPTTTADLPVAVPVVGGGQLVVVNPGSEEAELVIESADGSGKPREQKLPAGAAAVVRAPAEARLTSSVPVHAGVRYVSGGTIAGYPILAPDPRDGEITVYTR
ncbi:hypothetical protein H490_0104350 [Leucobacter sp. UCD-THU]|uniref:Large extracellular alpha-helical protein n=1 Tax=Leucobacter muris TaxID=1935379 RepID=A0ABX5QH96_9MICO|nr:MULTISPECIES: DUF5719 family protein [Leucobacter]EYT55855.1 hypothetical protein H490_0104350 [Leucobacter sp. UCD-THU]QAB18464.1 hypothetical protein Leucomu_11550 [Leucobacter muris]